jgi:nucleoid DNA-binding protein
MNNADLADCIAEAHSLSKTDVRKIVDGIFAAIADAAPTAMKSRSTADHPRTPPGNPGGCW